MEKNQEYAIVKSGSGFIYGRKVKELKSNGRAELEPTEGNKNGPVEYYHSLHTVEEGEALMKKLEELKAERSQKEILLAAEYYERIKSLFG